MYWFSTRILRFALKSTEKVWTKYDLIKFKPLQFIYSGQSLYPAIIRLWTVTLPCDYQSMDSHFALQLTGTSPCKAGIFATLAFK